MATAITAQRAANLPESEQLLDVFRTAAAEANVAAETAEANLAAETARARSEDVAAEGRQKAEEQRQLALEGQRRQQQQQQQQQQQALAEEEQRQLALAECQQQQQQAQAEEEQRQLALAESQRQRQQQQQQQQQQARAEEEERQLMAALAASQSVRALACVWFTDRLRHSLGIRLGLKAGGAELTVYGVSLQLQDFQIRRDAEREEDERTKAWLAEEEVSHG